MKTVFILLSSILMLMSCEKRYTCVCDGYQGFSSVKKTKYKRGAGDFKTLEEHCKKGESNGVSECHLE